MFGDVTFAQAPFAALGGNTFASDISESATASDAASQDTIAGGTVTETAAVTAVFASLNNIMQAIDAEAATATDAPAFAPSTVNAALAEMVVGSDIPTAVATFETSLSESVAASDATSTITNLFAAIAEAVTASDSVDRSRGVNVSIAEAAAGSAAQVTTVAFNATVSELATAIDSLSVIRSANVYPQGIQLLVSINNVLVWAVIDDSQNPNWQNINDEQSAGWTLVPTPSTPGWNDLPS